MKTTTDTIAGVPRCYAAGVRQPEIVLAMKLRKFEGVVRLGGILSGSSLAHSGRLFSTTDFLIILQLCKVTVLELNVKPSYLWRYLASGTNDRC